MYLAFLPVTVCPVRLFRAVRYQSCGKAERNGFYLGFCSRHICVSFLNKYSKFSSPQKCFLSLLCVKFLLVVVSMLHKYYRNISVELFVETCYLK